MVDLPYKFHPFGDDMHDLPMRRFTPEAGPLLTQTMRGISEDVDGLFSHNPDVYEKTGIVGSVFYPANNRSVRRHEVMHGYNHAAMLGVEGMPWQSRAVAALDRVPGLGPVADEMVARMAGGERPFSDVPWDWYSQHYAAGGLPSAARVAGVLDRVQKVTADPRTPMRVGLATGLATSPWWLDALSQDTE
jgi:hypothetical protein